MAGVQEGGRRLEFPEQQKGKAEFMLYFFFEVIH